MAQIGYDPQEITQLCEEVSAVASLVEAGMQEIDGLMKSITGDAVFADCEYRDTLLETKKTLDNSLQQVNDILANVEKKVNMVGEKVGASVKKNTMSIEEQNALINSAMAKTQQ